MKEITFKEIKQFKSPEVDSKIIEVQKELLELRFKQATRQTVKPHLFKVYKKILARLLTAQNN